MFYVGQLAIVTFDVLGLAEVCMSRYVKDDVERSCAWNHTSASPAQQVPLWKIPAPFPVWLMPGQQKCHDPGRPRAVMFAGCNLTKLGQSLEPYYWRER